MRSFTLKPVRLSKAEQKRSDDAEYAAVQERSSGVCEGCGERNATDMHHRKYRGRGGLTMRDNLIHLCGGESGMKGGNHSGCHGRAHTAIGEQLGWSVLTNNDPAIIPVFHRGTGLWTQNDEPINAWDAMETMTLFGQVRTGSGFAY